MQQVKMIWVTILLSSLSIHALADEPEYKIDTKILTIPEIKVGEEHVYNAMLKLNDAGNFEIVGFSNQPSLPGIVIDDKCTPDHLTFDKFKQITNGMSVEQINSLLGCKGEQRIANATFSEYWWVGGSAPLLEPLISVKFGDNRSFIQTYLP